MNDPTHGAARHYPAPVAADPRDSIDPEPPDEPGDRPVRAAVPFAAAAVVVYAAVTDPAHPARTALLAAAAAALAAWALAPRRVPSLALTAVVTTCVVLAKGSGDLDVGLFLVSLLAVVVAGWEPSRGVLATCCAAAVLTPVLVAVLRPGDVDVGVWVAGVALPAVMAWLLRRQDELRTELEESRRRLRGQAAAEERRRIARDVHDLVGHGLAAVLVQVAGARHVLRRDPDEAERALAAAEDAGRRSLGELRTSVALLRDGDGAVSPVPGLADLPTLAPDAVVAGDPTCVDPVVALTVYRIAQEALLNAARHAPGARTDVEIGIGDGIELRVRTRPGTRAVPVTRRRRGYGLVGMRERAAAVGGSLHAGPDGDGWLVHARLPREPR